MAQEQADASGPDLAQGVALSDFVDGKLLGHVGAEPVLLAQAIGGVFAVGALCSHYHAPLVDGLVVENGIRCPWHHACFDLQSGAAIRPPAWNPIDCWKVEQRDGRIFVTEKRAAAQPAKRAAVAENIVIVGGGAAGFAAAEMLRREGYGGGIAMLSQEGARPLDRPNLSKDNLAGTAPEDWLYLESSAFYSKHNIDLRLDTEVLRIDPKAREVTVAGGGKLHYDRLVLATGAAPVRLAIPGADQAHVHALRSLPDCRAILDGAKSAQRVLVIGVSFIGMEVAAALRTRGLEVHVVAPDKRPMERVLGPELGDFVRKLHEEHGVVFHLGDSVTAIDGARAMLKSGATLEADLIVVGVGVRPRLGLAEQAGLKVDRGVVVDRYLETSAPGIFAAGDIARWPDPHSGGKHPRRALGCGPAPGADRGPQHAGAERAVRCRPLLLEPALRRADQLCRPCRSLGRNRGYRRHRREGLPVAVQERRPRARRRLDLPGRRKSARRAGVRAVRGTIDPMGILVSVTVGLPRAVEWESRLTRRRRA